MPTYSYACTECGDRFDVVQAFTDDALTTCKQCAGRLRKLFNSVGIVFKGSGFYRTDSRESANGKKSTSPNGSGNTDSASSTSKTSASSGNGSGDKSGEKSGQKKPTNSSTSSTESTSKSTSKPASTSV